MHKRSKHHTDLAEQIGLLTGIFIGERFLSSFSRDLPLVRSSVHEHSVHAMQKLKIEDMLVQ